MKYKEKEKLWLNNVKELSKINDWKFKSYFIFKVVNDLFFSSAFHVSMKENSISGCLGYKPFNIDNVFWDIIDELPNKKMPLSFRGSAAFCIRKINYYNYKIDIKDEFNSKIEINELLKAIDKEVNDKSKMIKTLTDFQTEILEDEKRNCVGIITSLIEQKKFDDALFKINEYMKNDLKSGFKFGDKDFYDLAKEYCNKNIQ